MPTDPAWTRCLHLSAGTCPQLFIEGKGLSGAESPRPELTQDLTLERLALACRQCHLAPEAAQ